MLVQRFSLPKVRLLRESEAEPEEAVPIRLTFCALFPAELMATLPPRAPPDVGEKVILIVQLAPTASGAVQVLVWPKSPLAVMLLIVSVLAPWLVRLTACTE